MRIALLALAGCTASAAPAPPAPNIQQLADVPGWDAVVLANRIAVIDDGMLSVRGIDASTGKIAWSQKVQATKANGVHGLLVDRGAVMAWFAGTVHVLDGATGKPGASYATVVHGAGCGLWSIEGACARVCQCSFQIADCATGALRGKSYDGTLEEESDAGGGWSSGCWDAGGFLLGRAGSIATLSSVDHGTKPNLNVTAGVDMTTGKEAWRRELAAIPQKYESGHTADGKTCWFSDRDAALVVLDCATGKVAWTTKTVRVEREVPRHLVSAGPGRTLFEQLRTTAVLYAERTGKRQWSASVPANAIAWVKGGGQPLGSSLDKLAQIVVLDPATGKTLGTIPVPTSGNVTPDPDGGAIVQTPTEAIVYAATGAVIKRLSIKDGTFVFGTSLVAVAADKDLVVLDRKTFAEIGRIPDGAGTTYVEGPLGARRIATFRYDGKSIGRLRLWSVTP